MSPDPGAPVKALGVVPPAPPTTSVEKIQVALAAGTIDVPTSYLYRAYAQVDDPLLPEDYRGEPDEDLALDLLIRQELSTFAPEIQEQLMPYLVRPNDPISIWSRETADGGGGALGRSRSAGAARVPAPPSALACVDGWIHDRVSSTIPVMLWARCQFDPAAANVRLEEARGYFRQVWLPMTNHMGLPIGDRNIANDGYPDPPEGNDGLIDVYLVSGGPSVRDVTARPGIYGKAVPTAPFEGPAGAERSSGYLVIRPSLAGLILKATIVHELFHVLQNAHNTSGRIGCATQFRNGACPSGQGRNHWFVEASAAWSEHEFAPDVRPIESGPYVNWNQFIATADGLALTNGSNEYWSYMWPLFMEQEADADIIGDTWRNLRADVGWPAFQQTIDAQLSFEQRFDDFAVRVLNEELLPGNPINPRFRAPRLDPDFPLTTPSGPRYVEDVEEDLSRPLVAPVTTFNYTMTMDSLWSVYVPFDVPPGASVMRFEFAAFAPEIEVDAIVRNDGEWERRELPAGETEWCLDLEPDLVEDGYFVFSNHAQVPGTITRPWSITVEEAPCGSEPEGTLTYSFHDTRPQLYSSGSSFSAQATVQVRLKPNDDIGAPSVATYVNDGSTYGLQTTLHGVLPPGIDGCSPFSDTIGTPGGPLEIDSVVGNVAKRADGETVLSLGITLPVDLQIDESWCALGSGHSTGETALQFPDCPGLLLPLAGRDGRTFVFNCEFQSGFQSWSVTGTVLLAN